MQNQPSRLILSFGVADPVGACGIHADIATFAAFGYHALTVATGALIADSARVEDVEEIEADFVADQARVLLEDMSVAAIKIGSVLTLEQVSAIAEIVSDYPDVPLVLDPFLSCLPGQGLTEDDMLMALRQILVPQATLTMLSQLELARLADTWREPDRNTTLAADVAELCEGGCSLVLVTGAVDATGARADQLYDADGLQASSAWTTLPGPFVGAGATLSGAATALMAGGMEAELAIEQARQFTAGALARAQRYGMGKLVPDRFYRFATSSLS